MAEDKKSAAKAKVDENHIYKVQLKKFFPDWHGQALVMTQVYHVSGATLTEWLGLDIVGAYEVDNTVHPDAQAPERLDEPRRDVIDARHEVKDKPFFVPPRGQPG